MKLIIVRHGQTDSNANQLISGQIESTLTENGRKQAELLAARLAGEAFTSIFTSDLGRAKETTAIISRGLNITPIEEPLLRERSWGFFENRPVSEYIEARDSYHGNFWDFEPSGGESITTLRKRASSFAQGLKNLSTEGTYLISAHHSLNKALIFELLDRSLADWHQLEQYNTCVNIIQIGPSGVTAEVLNCTSHLALVS